MRFTAAKLPFVAAMQQVMRAIDRRTTLPILSGVMLAVEGKSLKLIGTDMDREVFVSVPLEDGFPVVKGKTVLNAATLLRLIKTLRDGAAFTISVDPPKKKDEDVRAEIKCGTLTMKMDAMSPDDFPEAMPTVEGHVFTHKFALDRKVLSRMMTKTRFCVSTEETRYYLNGVYFEKVGEQLVATATDGHRLAHIKVPLPNGAGGDPGMPGVIIPIATIDDMMALTNRAGSDIDIDLSDKYVRFTFDNVVLTSRLIDGSFPDYQRVIPFYADAKIVAERTELIDCIKRVSAIQTDRNHAISLSVAVRSDEMRVVARNAGEEASDTIGATFEKGTWYQKEGSTRTNGPLNEITIGFNSQYLTASLNHIDGDIVTMNPLDAGSPTILKGSDPDLLFVQMPLRV